MKLTDYIKTYKWGFFFDRGVRFGAHTHAWFWHHMPIVRWMYGLKK